MQFQNLGPVEYLYFGNLFPHEPQYKSGLFHGLALSALYDRDIVHDARGSLPFPSNSIKGVQSQDVFEHIDYGSVVPILDEVYRCLCPGGIFRLSLPDYNSPFLKGRSVYDSEGRILCDVAIDSRVTCALNEKVKVTLAGDGKAHLWFPTYSNLLRLIVASQIRRCSEITFHHAWIDGNEFICKPFEQGIMPVSRVPPFDNRADGKPVSIVVDFLK